MVDHTRLTVRARRLAVHPGTGRTAWCTDQALVPTFRSSCSIAAPTFTNFGKSWALANLLILVPLYRSEIPDRIRRLWCRDFRSAVLDLPFDQLQLELGDRLGGIQPLGAGLGAIHDRVAAIEPERVLEIVEPFAGGLVARIVHPAVRLQQRGRAEIAVRVPPIAWAGGRAASAENAFVKPIELFTLLMALPRSEE